MSGVPVNLPVCPPTLKSIAHYLKAASEHDVRDTVVSYWCRLYALQLGLKLSSHQPEETRLLTSIMDWLEATKKTCQNESITNEIAGQAYLENYALKLFLYADKQDREGNFGKNVVKAFYTSGLMYDVLLTFGELTDEVQQNRKYAKWKAAYIHNCLKNGETPVSGPMADENNEYGEEGAVGGDTAPAPAPTPQGPPYNIGFQPIPPTNPDTVNVPPSNPIDLSSPDALPSPPVEADKPPGGFKPYVPPEDVVPQYVPPPVDVKLTPDQMIKAQKYCKYAGSALNYDDVKTAIDNLQKALRLLTTGQDG